LRRYWGTSGRIKPSRQFLIYEHTPYFAYTDALLAWINFEDRQRAGLLSLNPVKKTKAGAEAPALFAVDDIVNKLGPTELSSGTFQRFFFGIQSLNFGVVPRGGVLRDSENSDLDWLTSLKTWIASQRLFSWLANKIGGEPDRIDRIAKARKLAVALRTLNIRAPP
jgi:hypothetical protein